MRNQLDMDAQSNNGIAEDGKNSKGNHYPSVASPIVHEGRMVWHDNDDMMMMRN